MIQADCPFCRIPQEDILTDNDDHQVIYDRYPVSKGHALIIPKRHVETVFELDQQEFSSIYALLNETKAMIDDRYQPDAYNVGTNAGIEAGQTVFHLHIHVIPRYGGDCFDPRGGVRWILPEKAVYWE